MSNSWSEAYFSFPIQTIETLKSSTTHCLDRITLTDKSQWLGKKLINENWLGTINFELLRTTEQLADAIYSRLNFYQCYIPTTRRLIDEKDYLLLVKPFIEGSHQPLSNSIYALRIGKLLGRIHALKLKQTNTPFPSFNLQELPNILPNWLRDVAAIIAENPNYQSEHWLDSHRDIHQENIIWQDHKPILIDWESAGAIHPFIELIGLGCNCAGVNEGAFRLKLFAQVLIGYKQYNRLPEADDVLWNMVYQSWILWIIFLLKYRRSIKESLVAVSLIRQELEMMKKVYRTIKSAYP